MSRAEVLLSGERQKCPAVFASKKVDRFENAERWYIEDCNHDRSPINTHKHVQIKSHGLQK